MKSRRVVLLLLLFFLSGFSGLIYQSMWSHYLGLVLGHAAYAQTLVLAIFMGGMALGAWWISRRSRTMRDPVRGYSGVELAIGLLGLGFHPIFLAYQSLSQTVVLPRLESAALVSAYQWTGAALLILPQSILLGATFPLISAGYRRLGRDTDGEVLGGLYFTNSLGAAVGALVATFVLLPWVGLPGAMVAAGAVNLLVAGGAWRWAQAAGPRAAAATGGETARAQVEPKKRTKSGRSAAPPVPKAGSPVPISVAARALLLASAITGASSFVYEIVWVRMLNQVLGSTVHSFEIMLSAFILGLALGGLWVRRRAGRITDPVRYLGYLQVWMGIVAALSAIAFAHSFGATAWLVDRLHALPNGYTLFILGTAAIAMAVMLPAALFAGTTLPLLTMLLLARDEDEAAIGRVYAANTLGAIVGVGLTVHALVPWLGLHFSLLLAASADIGLGLWFLNRSRGTSARVPLSIALCTVAALVFSIWLGRPDPHQLLSGVYLQGQFLDPTTRIAYRKDGKTTSVAVVVDKHGTGVIATNGKPDAGLSLSLRDEPTSDEPTMYMLAAVPLAIHPAPRTVAVIGWGSGLTTHALLSSNAVKRVDTVEIEPAMHEGARQFAARVGNAYDDPRSRVVFEDARSWFAAGSKSYDVIISEPSNPWVSGVANLFTLEYYQLLRRHLREDGLFVQWIHSYEFNDALLATIVAAVIEVFPDTELYVSVPGDLIMVARTTEAQQRRPSLDATRLRGEPLFAELQRVGVAEQGDFQVRRIAGPGLLRAYVRVMQAVPHRDSHPVVALQAPEARFRGSGAGFLQHVADCGLPVSGLLDGFLPPAASESVASRMHPEVAKRELAQELSVSMMTLRESPRLVEARPADAAMADRLQALSARPVAVAELAEWGGLVASLASLTLTPLPPGDQNGLWLAPNWLAPGQLPEIARVMAAYDATARREAGLMRRTAVEVLADPRAPWPEVLREQMLVIAMLGAAGSGDRAEVLALEQRFGSRLTRGQSPLRNVRMLLVRSAQG